VTELTLLLVQAALLVLFVDGLRLHHGRRLHSRHGPLLLEDGGLARVVAEVSPLVRRVLVPSHTRPMHLPLVEGRHRVVSLRLKLPRHSLVFVLVLNHHVIVSTVEIGRLVLILLLLLEHSLGCCGHFVLTRLRLDRQGLVIVVVLFLFEKLR